MAAAAPFSLAISSGKSHFDFAGLAYMKHLMLNLYAIYARNGTINILLPFTDLLRNARPYVTRPASFSSSLTKLRREYYFYIFYLLTLIHTLVIILGIIYNIHLHL